MILQNKALMEARLGVYDKTACNNDTTIIDGVENQMIRLQVEGGNRQQDRMIQAKRKSLDRALVNSYQAAEISHIGSSVVQKALINPNLLKQDYDDKILSVGYEHNYKAGDVLLWHRKKEDGTTDVSYWLIYLQDLTELAYFKGNIRRCNYWVNWEDEYGRLHQTWLTTRGPVETKINSLIKPGYTIDTPNHTLNILMPKTESTLKKFQRYSRFYMQGADDLTNSICWRVETVDSISMPGVLEITAQEYYADDQNDNLEEGIAQNVEIIRLPESVDYVIVGENVIYPKKSYTYTYDGDEDGQWVYDGTLPIVAKIDGKSITITWSAMYSGNFELTFGSVVKKIEVKSLF